MLQKTCYFHVLSYSRNKQRVFFAQINKHTLLRKVSLSSIEHIIKHENTFLTVKKRKSKANQERKQHKTSSQTSKRFRTAYSSTIFTPTKAAFPFFSPPESKSDPLFQGTNFPPAILRGEKKSTEWRLTWQRRDVTWNFQKAIVVPRFSFLGLPPGGYRFSKKPTELGWVSKENFRGHFRGSLEFFPVCPHRWFGFFAGFSILLARGSAREFAKSIDWKAKATRRKFSK